MNDNFFRNWSKTYEVWKTVPYNSKLDIYYVVLNKGNTGVIVKDTDEFIQAGFKSYEAGLDFIQVLQKLKG